ncbi:MAG: 50S ribosomal protein L17 [Opitutales bacterium]|nr:50S ribosomal protein L17 [Opitutales bacterium]
MRHVKHNHKLGVKTAHRKALVANLAAALLRHGRIRTTLPKAKALRPFIEKIITQAKRAKSAGGAAALHYKRTALARVRDVEAIDLLFNEKVEEFMNRNGGYTRIYKLVKRVGDAADMAIIELIPGDDTGYSKKKKGKAAKDDSAGETEEVTEVEAVEAEEVESTSDETAEPEAAVETPEDSAEEETDKKD